jgi:hypothetical protein
MTIAQSFHNALDEALIRAQTQSLTQTTFSYKVRDFFHLHVDELLQTLNKGSVFDLLSTSNQQQQDHAFDTAYKIDPDNTGLVTVDPPPSDALSKFNRDEAYANHNWELFYHIPVAIATHLSATGHFAEAQRWFHTVFDPTSTDPVAAPGRFWKFLPFRMSDDYYQIDLRLKLLSKPDDQCTAEEKEWKKNASNAYAALLTDPFNPHVVARTRPVAYQYHVVMKYLDNLIAWGDSLFLQYTVESINEATLLYVLAANILGERPKRVPLVGKVHAKSYDQLKNDTKYFDPVLGNALVNLESQFPFNENLPQAQNGGGDQGVALYGIGRTLYFCARRNTRLLAYWDTVADRLFKIRHCRNIQGVVVPLPLWDPPLDPGMLVNAAAAGIDIGSIVNGLNQPIGPLRSITLIQKSLELAGEMRSLGNALLSALEKGDAEHLAVLRQGHELTLQKMMQDTRFLQWKQAEEATQALLRTRASALERYRYYQRLLGLTPDANATPDTINLDRPGLTEETFSDVYATLVEQYDKQITPQSYPALVLANSASPGIVAGAMGVGRLYLNASEDADLNLHTPLARALRLGASTFETIGAALAMIPDMNVDLQFWGLGGHMTVFGGTLLASAMRFQSGLINLGAMLEEGDAAAASKVAGYQRRADDWMLQNNLAARELMQLGRQIIGSLIAEQVAHHEYLSVQQQITQSQEVLDTLQKKFTNEDLYGWVQGELFKLHQDGYRFAFDTARRAERTMKQELMRPELDATDFIQYNYWDAGRKGLLAGDKLYQDIKRMELAYHDSNRREYEMTRHVSLRQLDPFALLNLQCTGQCDVSLPEWLFDRDCPGDYMRRIRTVALSHPSVVGPYTPLNCKLPLLSSSVRKVPSSSAPYVRKGPDDDRFVDYVGGVSIRTSGGSNESGMFEPKLNDERFLPFEGAGVISTWRLELPPLRAFDYATIADVIFHFRYTAREGGADLADAATHAVQDFMSKTDKSHLALLYVVRSDFSTEWAAFADGKADLSVQVRKEHFPYVTQGGKLTLGAPGLYSFSAGGTQLTKSDPAPTVAGNLDPQGYVTVTLAKVGDALAAVEHAFLVVPYAF